MSHRAQDPFSLCVSLEAFQVDNSLFIMAEEKPRSSQPLLSSAPTRLFMKRSVMGDCTPGIVCGAGTYGNRSLSLVGIQPSGWPSLHCVLKAVGTGTVAEALQRGTLLTSAERPSEESDRPLQSD